MSDAKLQERLPLNYFSSFDDEAAILWDGLAKYRKRYDPNGTWPMPPEFYVHTCPAVEVPKLAADVASLAPAGTFLAEAKRVQMMFNFLALGTPNGPESARIPYVPLDNRGEV